MMQTLDDKEHPQVSAYRYVVLFASFLVFVAYAFAFQSVPPILRTLQSYFGVGDVQGGLLMSMIVIPGIALAIPAGLLTNRHGFCKLGFFSTILVALGSLATAMAGTFAMALLGRLIIGVGGAFLVVGAPTLIPQWFSHKEMGKAMGIYGMNMPIAIIIAFPTATLLTQNFGWQYAFYFASLLALVAGLVFAAVAREGSLVGHLSRVTASEIKMALFSGEVWKASLVWLFFNVVTMAFLSWAPTLFQDFKGLGRFDASLLASVVMYSSVVFVPLFGLASDRIGRRKPFIFAGSVSMAAILVSMMYADGASLFVSVLLLGVSVATIPPLATTIIAQSLPPRLSGTGFSIVSFCQNIGIAISAPLTGYILQVTGSLLLVFSGLSLFALTSAVISLMIRTR